jgi:hypothetical protein
VNLQQEYYLRNRIRAPFIYHGDAQLMFCRKDYKKAPEKYKWFQAKYVNREQVGSDGAYIGRFDVGFSRPIKMVSSMFRVFDEDIIYWNEYAEYVLEMVDELKEQNWKPLLDELELKLSCWELLSFSQDLNFGTLPSQMLDLNYEILDDNMSIHSRNKTLTLLLDNIIAYSNLGINQDNCRAIVSGWGLLNDMVYSSNYARWLAALITGVKW